MTAIQATWLDDVRKASDPTTSPDELGKLACSDVEAVAEAAADNPNTPAWAKSRFGARQAVTSNVDLARRDVAAVGYVNDKLVRELPFGRVQLASGGDRFFAYAIDWVVASIVAFVAAIPVVIGLSAFPESLGVLITSTFVLTYFAYFAVPYQIWGQTLGMRILKFKVVDRKTGGNLTWARAVLRAIVLNLALIVPFGWLIYPIWTFNDAEKRGPMDLAGSTVVVNADPNCKASLHSVK